MADDATPGMLDIARVHPAGSWLPIEAFGTIDSTNAELARRPLPWRVVVAEEQTVGRGRMGRPWVTTPGTALAVSALLPHGDAVPLGWVPLAAGLAVRAAIAGASGLATALKWPNDVLVPGDGDRKVAGILCEWTPTGVVVGAGVNVWAPRADLPLDSATSVAASGGGEVCREVLLAAYLTSLADHHERLAGEPDRVRADYRAACATLGRDVVIIGAGGDRRGRAVDVDAEGRLVVDSNGEVWSVTAGDVVHVR